MKREPTRSSGTLAVNANGQTALMLAEAVEATRVAKLLEDATEPPAEATVDE